MVAIALLCFCLTGCSLEKENMSVAQGETKPTALEFFSMDTLMSISSYGDDEEMATKANEKARKLIEEMDEKLSAEGEKSEILLLNKNGEGKLSEEGRFLFQKSKELYKNTDGAFNPMIYPAMWLWGFPSKEYRVPKYGELLDAKPLMDFSKAKLNKKSGKVVLETKGMMMDLGGIAKGYVADLAKETLKKEGIKAGIISLGGNICVWGEKPGGGAFKIAIQSPFKDNSYLGVLEVKDKSVVTSGGYERFFEKQGITYHHILDPKTLKPAKSGLLSVTIVSEDGTLADGLSTSLFVMGKQKSVEYWRKHQNEFEMVLFTEDKKLVVSNGLKDIIKSDYEIEVVEAGI